MKLFVPPAGVLLFGRAVVGVAARVVAAGLPLCDGVTATCPTAPSPRERRAERARARARARAVAVRD